MQNEKVFIIIVTYNAESWLPICCREFGALPEGWELLVVDNGSTDGTVHLLQKEYPHARLIENKNNLGFGRANNLALHRALAEGAAYAFLLNQDAEITLSAIQALIALQKQHPDCLVLSPVQLTGADSDLDYGFARCVRPKACPGLILDGVSGAVKDFYYSQEGVAAAWLLSREALNTIGGFNPLFYHYGEDEDYVNRILYHGYHVGLGTRIYARHHREDRPRVKKMAGTRFIDKLIRMADPSRPAPSRTAIVLSYMPAICRLLLEGRFSLAAYFFACCRNLLRGGRQSFREISKTRGPSFLGAGS